MKHDLAKKSLTILTVAGGWAISSAVHAAPAVAHWTVTDLGTLGGYTFASAINNAGQVTGNSVTADATLKAFLYSGGSMKALDGVPGGDSYGLGINEAGSVVGYGVTSRGTRAFRYSDGVVVTYEDLIQSNPTVGWGINDKSDIVGAVYGTFNFASAARWRSSAPFFPGGLGISVAYDINNLGVIVGGNQNDKFESRAFIYQGGVTTFLGTLGGGMSLASAINDAGQVTGYAGTSSGATHAFLYGNGMLIDLGTLGGRNSRGQAINRAGLVVGAADGDGSDQAAFLYANGAMSDLNTFNGIRGGRYRLQEAVGINDNGQIVANSTDGRAVIATLDTVVWESNTSGQWDATTGWSHGINPNKNTAVFIDPLRDLTVTGPAGAVTIRSLNVGGDATGNNGIATLDLAGGVITVTGLAESTFGTVISDKGVLSGNGVITGSVLNRGTVNATNLTMLDGLVSTGMLTGHGRLTTNLDNAVGGTLQLGAGQRLLVSGISHSSEGTVQIERGAELRVVGAFTHNAGAEFNVRGGASVRFDDGVGNLLGGRIIVDNGTIRFNGGLSNAGQLLVSYGGANIYGPITTVAGGQVILSANSNSAFFGTVEVQQGGELRVTSGSTATFFGEVLQRTGSVFSGGGRSIYEGGLSIGASPGLGLNEGDVTFGRNGLYLAEIGGTAACTEACATDDAFKNSSFDKYIVKGRLTLGGQLKLASWNDFVAQVGMSFDLLDWGSVDGTFSSIDASGLRLASGAQLDLSRLYTTGTISVMAAPAVPEPSAWVLALAGVSSLLGRGSLMRRKQ